MCVAMWEQIPKRTISLEDLAGRTVAIDAFNTIYYFLTVIRHQMSGEPLEVGIRPVCVFTGHYADFKKRTVQKRRAKREEAKRRWKEAMKKGEPALKYAQEAARIDARIMDSAKALLARTCARRRCKDLESVVR